MSTVRESGAIPLLGAKFQESLFTVILQTKQGYRQIRRGENGNGETGPVSFSVSANGRELVRSGGRIEFQINTVRLRLTSPP